MDKVFIIGGTTYDHIVHLPTLPPAVPHTIHQAVFHEATGSTGSGKALAFKKLGVESSLYSLLGDDVYGRQIIQHLKDEGVAFYYDFDPAGTERHINLMDAEGGRISIFVTQSSEKPPMNLHLIEDQILQSDLLVLNIIAYCKVLAPMAKASGKPVWTDLHDYTDHNPYHEPFIEASDVIFLSSDNLPDYRRTMQELMNRGKQLVVCTHGKNGSTALTSAGEWIEQQAYNLVPMVDANGAGDNFFAGFLWAFLQKKPFGECMKYGSVCGALCVGSKQLVHEELSVEKLYKHTIFQHKA